MVDLDQDHKQWHLLTKAHKEKGEALCLPFPFIMVIRSRGLFSYPAPSRQSAHIPNVAPKIPTAAIIATPTPRTQETVMFLASLMLASFPILYGRNAGNRHDTNHIADYDPDHN